MCSGAWLGYVVGCVAGWSAPCGPFPFLWYCFTAPACGGLLGCCTGSLVGGVGVGTSTVLGGLCEFLGAVNGLLCQVCADVINCVSLGC